MVDVVSIDCETFRIGPGAVAPKMVCFSVATRPAPDAEIVVDLVGNGDPGCEEELRAYLEVGRTHLVLQNGAFDLAVIDRSYPALRPLIWAKLEAREVSDTILREMLLNLSTCGKLDVTRLPDGSTVQVRYGLAELTLRYLGIDISESKKGDDAWRVNYDVLDGMKASDYPADARAYAMDDASYTLRIYEEQEKRVESRGWDGTSWAEGDGHASLHTETFQAAVAYALYRITVNGMAVDSIAFKMLEQHLAREMSGDKVNPLFEAGILAPRVPSLPHKAHEAKARGLVAQWLGIAAEDVRWDLIDDELRLSLVDSGYKFKEAVNEKLNKKELQRRVLSVVTDIPLASTLEEMVIAAKETGLDYKKTDGGDVSTDAEVIDSLAGRDPIIACFQHRQKLQKLLTTELPRMTWEGKIAPRVHFNFKTILETGRTSSYTSSLYPSGNGQQVDPRARPVFVPRQGFVLCSCDYSMLELVSVAQTTYEMFGYSVHRDKIREGKDLHAYLGSKLTSRFSPEFIDVCGGKSDEDTYKIFFAKKREDAKFYKHWRTLAKPVGLGLASGMGPAKMMIVAKRDYDVDICALAEKEDLNREDDYVKYHAERLEVPDGEWTPMLRGIALAKEFRDVWLETYPEMGEYFEWVKQQGDRHNEVIKTLREEEVEEFEGLCYTSPMGMHRAAATYTAVANGRCLQTPAAEGFKVSVFNLVRACDGDGILGNGTAFVNNEIHDEMIVELKEDEHLHERAAEVKRIMEDGMGTIMKDVPVKANPVLMRRWWKSAEGEGIVGPSDGDPALDWAKGLDEKNAKG